MEKFTAYIAFGDSMSIDLYPALDLGQAENTPLGSAALFFSNSAKFWPDYAGRDLKSALPDLAFVNLTEDGATTWDLLDSGHLIMADKYADEPVLITLTLGGNDALRLLWIEAHQGAKLTAEASDVVDRYRRVLAKVREQFSRATIILNTIYDPSDGTGVMPNFSPFPDKLPFLGYINAEIRACAKEYGLHVADVHKHFLGHGTSVPVEQRWYWSGSPIEPGAKGASEIRGLWLQCLGM